MVALYALFSGPVRSTGAGILVSCGRTSNQGGHRSKARARLSSSHHQGSPRGVTGCLTESWREQGYLGLSSHLAWRRAQNSQQGKITPYLSDRPPRDIGHNKNVPMPFPNTHTPSIKVPRPRDLHTPHCRSGEDEHIQEKHAQMYIQHTHSLSNAALSELNTK